MITWPTQRQCGDVEIENLVLITDLINMAETMAVSDGVAEVLYLTMFGCVPWLG